MTELTYRQEGDYLIPNITAEAIKVTGKYASLRLRYLQNYKEIEYINLLTSQTLNKHLATVQKEASERVLMLVEQMKKAQGITEELKAKDMMAWVGRMNEIHHSAEEIVFNELIYV